MTLQTTTTRADQAPGEVKETALPAEQAIGVRPAASASAASTETGAQTSAPGAGEWPTPGAREIESETSDNNSRSEQTDPIAVNDTPAVSASTTNATATVDGPAGIPAHRQVSGGRINPDARAFVRVIIIGTVIAGTVAFAISFVALMEIAHWLGIPSWMSWSIPVFIDLAILIYAGSILVHKARGDRTWRSWVMLGVFTGLSMVANVSHALSSGTSTEAWQAWVGAVIAGMVPIAIFAATEQLASIAVQDPETRRAELEAEATWAAEQADREREQIGLEHEREMARQRAELDRERHVTEIEIARARRSHLVEKAAQGIDLDHSPTESSPTEPRPTPNRTKSPSPARATADLDAIAAFVEEAQDRGERVSGAALAEAGLVSSGKTGQRRLASLKKQRPDLFEVEDPTPAPGDGTAAEEGAR